MSCVVKKRSGKSECVSKKKLRSYMSNLCVHSPPLSRVNLERLLQTMTSGFASQMDARDIPDYVSEVASSFVLDHYEYGYLAGRAIVSKLHKETPERFSYFVKASPFLSDEFKRRVAKNATEIDNMIVHNRDYHFDIFGIKTLQRSYLLKENNRFVERPQYMYMRVAVMVGETLPRIQETYEALSQHRYTHATPTLFHAGFKKQQLASCFLMTVAKDSIDSIFNTIKKAANISKGAGGIGLAISNVRGKGSLIKGTGGTSNGIVPMIKVINETMRYVDQGGGKRKGSCALYLEPHHPDILDFLQMKKPNGLEEHRARDLFYAVYLSDLFMERVKDDQMWSLIDPNECPALQDAVGDQYRSLYQQLEKENRIVKSIRARQLWFDILDAQTETGTPYILYKDACNLKSNQKNLGTIRCSNLCAEILEYTSEKEVAVCTLASIALNKFVKNNQYDFEALAETTKLVVRNLDRCIDCTYYPIKEAKTSNKKHRPMGIGVQALADVFALLKMPYESEQAATLNKQIFETMYYAALTESHRLATVKGAYDTFGGSPLSKGQFQFDLWDKQPLGMYDWNTLRSNIQRDGVRHSLLLALMPTASTAQIMGNTESFEPRTSNLYTRRVLSGEYVVVNKQLQDYLYDEGLWMSYKDQIIRDRGSVKNLPVSQEVKDVFKTVWEISQKSLINMAADRGIYIDQTQSFNLYVAKPSRALLSTIHMYTWKKGLKTGCYYLRSRPAADAIQFTVAVEEDNDVCMSCSS